MGSDAPATLTAQKPTGASREWIFRAAILLSAFLLFLVQPMVGKRILPWFGGTPAVWTLCLVFYQSTLFLGYAYAHLLIRFASPNLQLVIHAMAVCAALFSLPVLPNDTWQPTSALNPSGDILAMLIVKVALPFLVLASTGPLVQAWFFRRHPLASPYPLYALSNLGSLAALLSYPFFVEPRFSLSATETFWSYTFAVSCGAGLSCAAIARRAEWGETDAIGVEASRDSDPLVPSHVALWFLLAGCAVVVLMGVTNTLSVDVASIPFLWVLPLATYLITFILCFGSERAYRRTPVVALTGIALSLILFPFLPPSLVALLSHVPLQIAIYCVLLFAVCMIMHGELYRLRPPARALTAFYLCVSAGGAVGGLFVGIVARVLFTGYYELTLGLSLAWLLLLFVCWRDPSSWLRAIAPRRRWGALGFLTLAGLSFICWPQFAAPHRTVHKERSFFGRLSVVSAETDSDNFNYQLWSGTTLHGYQFQKGRRNEFPTSYYGRASGIGLTMVLRAENAARRVGVVGLGVGTLAAYGLDGDLFRFYEIDPAVVRIARDESYFNFLRQSRASIEIVVGDARLSLAREYAEGVEQNFDILVVDAFSSDAIPIHLLTSEAFTHYANALAEGGLLAMHVSNRHFDLAPMVARHGLDSGMVGLRVQSREAPHYQSHGAVWVLMSRDGRRIEKLAEFIPRQYRTMGLDPETIEMTRAGSGRLEDVRAWTDDFSDLLSLLK